MESSLKFIGTISYGVTKMNITKDEYYKTHFKENKKKLKTIWETIKEIINVKNNDMPINSLLIGETITTNAKLIANHFNSFLQVLLLN